MACTTLVTLEDAEFTKLICADLQLLVYSASTTFVDAYGETTYTINGIKAIVEGI